MAQIVNACVTPVNGEQRGRGASMDVMREGDGGNEVSSGVARMQHLRRSQSPLLTLARWEPHRDELARSTGAAWSPVGRLPSERLNRALNVILAAAGLLMLAPLMLLIAIAVKLTSRGPVLYAQVRVGLDRRRRAERGARADRRSGADRRIDLDRRGPPANRRATTSRRARMPRSVLERRMADVGGHAFRIYKFRSMCVDAECRSGAVWATRNDPRVTRLGKLLRHFRLDELPQLYNVLKGDMNIVGPRPERPSIFRELRAALPEYWLRQRARPGITGWAQIKQSYDACVDDVRRKVGLDLEYLRRRSVWVDLGIMLRTIPVMLFKRGAC